MDTSQAKKKKKKIAVEDADVFTNTAWKKSHPLVQD